jgi:hypothetical protein
MPTLVAIAALARRGAAAENGPGYFAPAFDFATRALTGFAEL